MNRDILVKQQYARRQQVQVALITSQGYSINSPVVCLYTQFPIAHGTEVYCTLCVQHLPNAKRGTSGCNPCPPLCLYCGVSTVLVALFGCCCCRGRCRQRVEELTSGEDPPFLFMMNIQVGPGGVYSKTKGVEGM